MINLLLLKSFFYDNPVLNHIVTPDTSLLEALRLLLAHRIKRLPVVDAEGRLVGKERKMRFCEAG